MMLSAGLSFMLPPGLSPSSFAKSRKGKSGKIRVNRMRGVSPMAERIPSFITSLPDYHLAQQTLRTDRVLQVKGLTPDGVILFREKHAGLEDLADRLRAGKAAALYAKLMNHSFMSLREKAAVRAEWR